ncbi:MAG TPA: hypothetical protein VLI69_04275 [Gammaproteobacteria bacterium]|nr:hypothetical protein [Gammaproteobacteria bacterium]
MAFSAQNLTTSENEQLALFTELNRLKKIADDLSGKILGTGHIVFIDYRKALQSVVFNQKEDLQIAMTHLKNYVIEQIESKRFHLQSSPRKNFELFKQNQINIIKTKFRQGTEILTQLESYQETKDELVKLKTHCKMIEDSLFWSFVEDKDPDFSGLDRLLNEHKQNLQTVQQEHGLDSYVITAETYINLLVDLEPDPDQKDDVRKAFNIELQCLVSRVKNDNKLQPLTDYINTLKNEASFKMSQSRIALLETGLKFLKKLAEQEKPENRFTFLASHQRMLEHYKTKHDLTAHIEVLRIQSEAAVQQETAKIEKAANKKPSFFSDLLRPASAAKLPGVPAAVTGTQPQKAL